MLQFALIVLAIMCPVVSIESGLRQRHEIPPSRHLARVSLGGGGLGILSAGFGLLNLQLFVPFETVSCVLFVAVLLVSLAFAAGSAYELREPRRS